MLVATSYYNWTLHSINGARSFNRTFTSRVVVEVKVIVKVEIIIAG